MSFVEALIQTLQNNAQTLNGAKSNASTGSFLLDFFSKGSANRENPEKANEMFVQALHEDEAHALKALFYLRDIRGGQGERKIFRHITQEMAKSDELRAALLRNMKFIPDFGRWDDLIILANLENIRNDVLQIVKEQFDDDQKNVSEDKPISLLAKWMKSENASSKKGTVLARMTRDYFGMKSSEYRKAVHALRERLKLVESNMSQGKWGEINYEAVPSYAMKRYFKAFGKHDDGRFAEFKQKVKEGSAKINSKTLFPYDLVSNYLNYGRQIDKETDELLTLQWNALPDYMEGRGKGIAVIDVSGSMSCGGKPTPLAVAISLGLYMGEKISGEFHNKFITFSYDPCLVEITGETLGEKVTSMEQANWSMSTNLISVFSLILNTAQRKSTPPEEMPEVITIISDMQFNVCCRNNDKTNLEKIKHMYEKAGYVAPSLVFWNVNDQGDTPATMNEQGVCLISGNSPTILQSVFGIPITDPFEFMMKVLDGERYECIQ